MIHYEDGAYKENDNYDKRDNAALAGFLGGSVFAGFLFLDLGCSNGTDLVSSAPC